ncbi:hypothetical protein E3T54_05500 [Cryobacterium sp. Sr8]|uniref:hypothetical protein n=1 Tax=Cryobacterium sp. Sr8 TaxID=1259203 RepID=UPI0011028952|nr:hypothetical protein [Cryobacterium sp. Sr8]TFD79133.1 hypothetical protein E3T54_05500 [Cryobacterium sp. Sr8]
MAALPATEVLFIVANPVAHGARLAQSVTRGVRSSTLSLVADARFSDPALAVDFAFPGISARSLKATVTVRRLRFAVAARRALPRGVGLRGSANWLYREYIFAAQAVRYAATHAAVSKLAPTTILLTDFDRSAYCRPWIWAAKRAGMATATLMHGSPNELNYIPVLADNALVWGQAQESWLAQRSPDTSTMIIGRPDLSSTRLTTAPAERVVLCHSREALTPRETQAVGAQLRAFKSRGLTICLRFHPTSAKEDLGPGWHAIAGMADEVVPGRGSFAASLRGSDIVVCVASSAAIESVALGIPTIVLAGADRSLPADLEAIRAQTPEMLEATRGSGPVVLSGSSAYVRLAAHLLAASGPAASDRLDRAVTAVRRGAA